MHSLKQKILMSPLPKIRFKLFSWEKDKKKMKDLNPCLSFQITYGGEKKDPFVFV